MKRAMVRKGLQKMPVMKKVEWGYRKKQQGGGERGGKVRL